MPVFSETFVAIKGAKLPEGRKPRSAISGSHIRAGRNEPTFHNQLHESTFQQPISMNPAQFTRLKNTTPVFLKFLENAQRCRQFFVRCRHLRLFSFGRIQVYRAVQLQVYADVRLQVNYAVRVQVYSANNRDLLASLTFSIANHRVRRLFPARFPAAIPKRLQNIAHLAFLNNRPLSISPGYSFVFASLRRKVSLAAWVLRISSIVKWNSSSPP
jgi:hypothetical protein